MNPTPPSPKAAALDKILALLDSLPPSKYIPLHDAIHRFICSSEEREYMNPNPPDPTSPDKIKAAWLDIEDKLVHLPDFTRRYVKCAMEYWLKLNIAALQDTKLPGPTPRTEDPCFKEATAFWVKIDGLLPSTLPDDTRRNIKETIHAYTKVCVRQALIDAGDEFGWGVKSPTRNAHESLEPIILTKPTLRPFHDDLAIIEGHKACEKCNGWGRWFGHAVELCPNCNGTGHANPENALMPTDPAHQMNATNP